MADSSDEAPNLDEQLKQLVSLKGKLTVDLFHIKYRWKMQIIKLAGIVTTLSIIINIASFVICGVLLSWITSIILEIFVAFITFIFAWCCVAITLQLKYNWMWETKNKLKDDIVSIDLCEVCLACLMGNTSGNYNYNNGVKRLIRGGFNPIYGANLDNQIMKFYLDKRSKLPLNKA